MNTIDVSKLKIGDILKSMSDYSNINKNRIKVSRQTRKNIKHIRCSIRKHPNVQVYSEKFNIMGQSFYVDCHTEMLDVDYMFLGRPSYYRFTDALTLVSLKEKRFQQIIPLDILKTTGRRIIDLRKMPTTGEFFDDSFLSNGSIPISERLAIEVRLRKQGFLQVYETVQKNRLKWFLNDKNLSFKELLVKMIRTYNKYNAVHCRVCSNYISTFEILDDGYTRANKLFIVCSNCATRSYVGVTEPENMANTNSPFCLLDPS